MPLDFPSNPTPGAVYTGSNNILYTYDGVRWVGSVPQTDFTPSNDLVFDLGEQANQWRTLFAGSVKLSSTATSTGTNTGALVVSGGSGIAGSLYVGGTIYQRGYAVSTGSAAAGVTSIVAGTGTFVSSSTGAITVWVSPTGGGITSPYSGIFTVTNTTEATSTNTGAVQIAGGLGVHRRLNVAGLTTITNNTTATSITDAALVVRGGIGVVENIYVGTNIVFPDSSIQTSAYTGGQANNRVTNVFMNNGGSVLSVNSSTTTLVPFDTASTGHDAGDINLGTSEFRPTIAGWYTIAYHLNWAGTWSGNVTTYLYKNNAEEKIIGSSWIGNGGGLSGSVLSYFNGSTDYIDIRVNQASTATRSLENGANKTWLQATWLRA